MEKQEQFNGELVAFDITDATVMVSASSMAKIIGKKVNNFTGTEQTIAFIDECIKDENFFELMGNGDGQTDREEGFQGCVNNLELQKMTLTERRECFVKQIHGGRKNGTWMHRVVAIKFAAWLSPAFELWVFKTMEKLMFGNKRIIDASIKREAEYDAKIEALRKKLESTPEFKQLEQLKFDKGQEARRRGKFIKLQISGQTSMDL